MKTIQLPDALWDKLCIKAQTNSVSPETLLETLLDDPPLATTFWQKALDTLNTSCILVDAQQPDYPVVEVNPVFEKVTGYQRAEVIGKNLRFLQGDDHDQPALATIREALKAGEACITRLRNYRKDGSLFWNELYISPIFDDKGNLTHFIAIQNDVTREELYYQDLIEREQQARQFIELSSEGIWRINRQHKFLFVNHRMAAMLGYPVVDLLQLSLDAVLMEDNTLPDFPADSAKRDVIQQDLQFRHQDGCIIWTISNIIPLFDANGQYAGALGFVLNITERKQAEMQLAESEARFKAITELTSDYAFKLSVLENGQVQRDWITAPAMQRITGFTPEESAARGGWAALAHPDDLPHLNAILQQQLQKPQIQKVPHRIITRNGTIRYMEGLSLSIADDTGKVTQIIGSARDITEQMLAQQNLMESEARFRTMADYISVLIWLADSQHHCVYVNKSWLAFTGRTLEQELGSGWSETIHPDDYARITTQFQDSYSHPQPFLIEYRMRRYDGVYRWIQNEGVPRYTPDGQFAGFVGTCADVTEIRAAKEALTREVHERTLELQQEIRRREQAEAELRREHDLLEKTIRMSPAAILLVNRAGTIIFASDRVVQLSEQSLVNTQIFDNWFITDAQGTPIPNEALPVQTVFATREAVEAYELSFQNSQGEQKTIAVSAAPLFNADGEVHEVVATVEEITLRKQWEITMQSLLAHERQLNTMKSQFISTITHEFKTPLTIIRTSCYLLRTKQQQMLPNEYHNRLERIEQQVTRLNTMIDDIVQLNRMNTASFQPHYEWVDLPEMLRHIADDVQLAYQRALKIKISFHDKCQRHWLDTTLTHQIFLNLISNAVKYSTQNQLVDVTGWCENQMVCVTIRDFGIGIPKAEQGYLFTDFFRASNVKTIPGTGVGLTIVRRSIEILGGQLTFVSEENQGTTFSVMFPTRPQQVGTPLTQPTYQNTD
jgi:PAS domain S-box-containing protein